MMANELELESASAELALEIGRPEQMAPSEAVGRVQDAWRSLPPDIKQEIQRRALLVWQMRGAYLNRFLATLAALYAQNPSTWKQALLANRAAAAQQLATLAGRMAGLPVRNAPAQHPFSDVRVRQFHRRQQARGFVPGRNRQTGLYRELEFEIERASHELEAAEPFYTKVTPIPGIGNKEGHEILPRIAMRGLPLTAAERSAVLLGVIRPDRGWPKLLEFPACGARFAGGGRTASTLSAANAVVYRACGVAFDSRAVCRFASAGHARIEPIDRSAMAWRSTALTPGFIFQRPCGAGGRHGPNPSHPRFLHSLWLAATLPCATRAQRPVRPAR
jgi:hypothetical protein